MRVASATSIPLMFVLGWVSGSATALSAEPAPVPVTTIAIERRAITPSMEFVGRIEAPERVEVRARVKGELEGVLFKEGDVVHVGAPLYRIEKSLFEADVTQAMGALDRSEAGLQLAVIQRKRAQELLERNSGTVVARDQAVAEEKRANGSVLSDQAALKTAQINLGYTDIASPVAGRVGRTAVTKGNIVGPDSGVLAVILSQDPMHVSFPVSQADYLKAKKSGNDDQVYTLDVGLKFSDGSSYGQNGKVTFVDVKVDKATDTLIVRADFPNAKGVLIDGQLVRVMLQTGAPQERVLAPQAALIADQQGLYVFVVEGGKAVIRRVKSPGLFGSEALIGSGLNGGEQVVVEGLQMLRPGASVTTTPFKALQTGG
jgi:membrane fusion protein, multidrug efflux system